MLGSEEIRGKKKRSTFRWYPAGKAQGMILGLEGVERKVIGVEAICWALLLVYGNFIKIKGGGGKKRKQRQNGSFTG